MAILLLVYTGIMITGITSCLMFHDFPIAVVGYSLMHRAPISSLSWIEESKNLSVFLQDTLRILKVAIGLHLMSHQYQETKHVEVCSCPNLR